MRQPLETSAGMMVELVTKSIEEMRAYLLANEKGNQRSCSRVQLRRTTFESGATCGDAVATKAFLNCVCTPTLSGSKSDMAVRQNIETTHRRSRRGEGSFHVCPAGPEKISNLP